jgi:uncharacterized membrane protein (UPF0136 family)
MKKTMLLTFAGIVLLIVGYLMERNNVSDGVGLQSFGAGILFASICLLLYFIRKRKTTQQ